MKRKVISFITSITIMLLWMMPVSFAASAYGITLHIDELTASPGTENEVEFHITCTGGETGFTDWDVQRIVLNLPTGWSLSDSDSSDLWKLDSSGRIYYGAGDSGTQEDAIDISDVKFKMSLIIPDSAEEGDYNITIGSNRIIRPGTATISFEIDLDPWTVTVNNNSSGTSEQPAYQVSFSSTVQSVAPGETFTVPVILTSSSDLAAAQFNLAAENADIISVTDDNNTLKLKEGEAFWNASPSTEQDEAGQYIVSFYGNAASAKTGLTAATVELKAKKAGTPATLTVTKGVAARTGRIESGEGIAFSNIDELVPVSVNVVMPNVTVAEFLSGVYLVRYEPTGTTAEGTVPMYDGKAMYKGTNDNYLFLVKSSDVLSQETAVAAFSLSEGQIAGDISLLTKGDLNGNDSVNIVDAQIAYDLAKGMYTEKGFDKMSSESLDMLHWLMADVNGSDTVEAADARAIQVFIHTGSWNKA